MFRQCPHHHDANALEFFYWYIKTHIPHLWAAVQLQREEKQAARTPAAALAAVPPLSLLQLPLLCQPLVRCHDHLAPPSPLSPKSAS